MKNEITVNEVGGVFWIVFADSKGLASTKAFDDETRAWKNAEKHAARYGYKVVR